MTKHTQGPWIYRESHKPDRGTLWRDIVSIGLPFSPSYVGEALEQDASLIAAAPDLFEAAKNVLSTGISSVKYQTALAALAKAVAKAEDSTRGLNV